MFLTLERTNLKKQYLFIHGYTNISDPVQICADLHQVLKLCGRSPSCTQVSWPLCSTKNYHEEYRRSELVRKNKRDATMRKDDTCTDRRGTITQQERCWGEKRDDTEERRKERRYWKKKKREKIRGKIYNI